MKKFKFLAPLGAALLLSSCSPFVSHWSAKIFIHSNTSHAASMTFDEFEGLIVFNLKSEDKEHSVLEYKLLIAKKRNTTSLRSPAPRRKKGLSSLPKPVRSISLSNPKARPKTETSNSPSPEKRNNHHAGE